MSYKRARSGYTQGSGRARKMPSVSRGYARTRLRSAGRVTRTRAAKMAVANTRTGGYLGIEYKFYDSKLVEAALTGATDASGGEHDESATLGPTTIAQGDGEQNRDGRKCTVKSVFVNGIISRASQADQTAADVAAVVYVALVMDTQTNGALLNSEDVFKNIAQATVVASQPVRNLLNTTRFRVLDRTTIVMPQPEMVWDGTNIEQAGMAKPFQLSWKGVMTQLYSNTTATIANVTDNSIHIIAYSNNATAAPKISYNCRARFVG